MPSPNVGCRASIRGLALRAWQAQSRNYQPYANPDGGRKWALSPPEMTFVTTFITGLLARRSCAYAGGGMPRTMIWLAAAIRVAIAPVLLGALVLRVNSLRSPSDLAVSAGLVLLGAIHVVSLA